MAATNDEEYLSNAMRACVDVCAERGFSFPLLLMMAGSHGALLAARFLEHEDGQIHTEMLAHDADERTLGWPINVIVVDACGRTVRLRMGATNTRPDSTLN